MRTLYEKLLYYSHSVSLRVKITGIVILSVSLLGLLVIMETRAQMKDILSSQLEKRGYAIASDVAARSTNPMLVGDTFSLHEIASGVPSHYEDVRYIIILDNKGQVVAHSFGEGVPVGLLDLRPKEIETVPQESLYFTSDEGEIIDISVPIAQGKVGSVRIGMSENSIFQSIDDFSQQILVTTILISIFGLLGAMMMSHLATRPIRDLAYVSRKISSGDFTQRVSTQGEDEIAHLGHSFNTMASSIELSTRERDALVRELQENEKIRQELLKKVISAQEDERKRISRELHDETGQSLTSLLLGLKLLNETEDVQQKADMVIELKTVASKTLQEVHRLAVELRPTVLDDMGLVTAIERYVNSFTHQYNIDVGFHVQTKSNSRLPEETETILYRIVQEALTNVAKYAQAQNVSVLLEQKADFINLIVEDDGLGFEVDRVLHSTIKDSHLGIAGMKERTALLGGEFSIESVLSQGTTVYVRIPVERSKADAK